jgi:hypothetical protein
MTLICKIEPNEGREAEWLRELVKMVVDKNWGKVQMDGKAVSKSDIEKRIKQLEEAQ